MPFTPFHFGPGLAVKGMGAPVFSWSAFAAAQVLIDCETLYYLLHQEYPVHRFLHSFLGAAVAGLAATILCLVIVRAPGLRRPRLVTQLLDSPSVARGERTSLGILLGVSPAACRIRFWMASCIPTCGRSCPGPTTTLFSDSSGLRSSTFCVWPWHSLVLSALPSGGAAMRKELANKAIELTALRAAAHSQR